MTCTNFVMLKALETHADILQIKFRVTLKLNATSFYPNKFVNVSKNDANQKITLQITLKSTTTSKDKTEKTILADEYKSIEQKETSREHIHNTKLLRNENLWIKVKGS